MSAGASRPAVGDAASTGWLQRLDAFQRRHRLLGYPLAVVYKFIDDQGAYLAALLAYYGFVSLFPLLLLAVTVLGFVLADDPAAQQAVLHSALREFPVIGDQIATNIHSLHGSVVGLVVGVLIAVYGGLGVTQAGIAAMNQLWAVPVAERPGLATTYARGVVLLLLVWTGVVVTTALTALTTKVGGVLPGGAAGTVAETAARVGSSLTAVLLNVGLIVLGFRLLTFRRLGTRQHLPGAVVAAVAWQVLQLTGTYLVSHELRGASASYGFFGIVLGLLLWIYLSALVLLLSAEVNTVRVLRLAPRSLLSVAQPDDPAVTWGDRRAFTAYARSQRRKSYQRIEVSFDPDTPSATTSRRGTNALPPTPDAARSGVSQPSSGSRGDEEQDGDAGVRRG